jgi:serine/threonine protein phosphatase PrpC
MDAVVISERGIRPTMEDAQFLDVNFDNRGLIFGGIYDGHGGEYAAKYAADRIHKIFLEKLRLGMTPGQAFNSSYESVSGELYDQESGTTAADFLIQGHKIFTANVGDTRILLVKRKSFIQLTTDHRLSSIKEEDRIKKLGASISYPYIIREGHGLMITRSLGDHNFETDGVVWTPSLNEYIVSSDDMMLISASDGLWNFMSNGEIASIVLEHQTLRSLLENLVKEVLVNRSGTDNLTVIAVSLLP